MLIALGLIPQPITQMIQACGWIPLMWNWSSHYLARKKSNEMLTLPLSGQPQSGELLESWKAVAEVEVMNRAARVTAERKLPEWVQRWLSYRNQREGTQWCTCAGGIPNYPARTSKDLCRKMDFVFFLLPLYLVCKPGGKRNFHTWQTWQSRQAVKKWCRDIVLRALLSWQPPELLKEMRVSWHASSSHLIPKTNVTF